ncbi:unnamed protein product, partial [Polarella glacialis]
ALPAGAPALVTPPPLPRPQRRKLSPVREVGSPVLGAAASGSVAIDEDLKAFPSAPSMPALQGQPVPAAEEATARAVAMAEAVLFEEPKAQTRGSRWQIDEQWLATRHRDGRIVDSVQLDAAQDYGLGREGWEKRFSRREHQIRIGK